MTGFNGFTLPPRGFGPGSQPPADGDLAFTPMPQDMRTYAPHVPEITDAGRFAPALALVDRLAAACDRVAAGGPGEVFETGALDPANRRILAETLGEGEVAVKLHGRPAIAVQESVFAGVWVVAGAGVDRIEVASFPAFALARAFAPRRAALGAQAPQGRGVMNALPLMVELADQSTTWRPGRPPHVVNLTLLPHTAEDLDWLDAATGLGSAEILSRGYGAVRVTATALPQVWRVRFFNAMDTVILDTFEVCTLPEVALAAAEDLADSAARIRAVREAMA